MRILVVEDDEIIANNVRFILEQHTYAVDVAHTKEEGRSKALSAEYDLLLLDWMLPDGDGVELSRELRGKGMSLPILMLTAKNQVEDTIEGLDSGADDYLSKPFDMEVLLARIRALLRRKYTQNRAPVFQIADLTIDTNAQSVQRQGQTIELSPKLYALLEYLARNACQAQTRLDILEHVWDEHADSFTNTVDVHIRYLRQKIDEGFSPQLIKTVKGTGYMLCDN